MAGNIRYSHGAALELQYSAAMVAALMMFRRRPTPTDFGIGASFPRKEAYDLARFKRRSHLAIRAMLLALIGCALPCGAVTLGDATLLSDPARPLRVEIELASELQPGLEVRLASEQAFRESGLSYPAWLGRAQVSLLPAQGQRRRPALLLTAPQTVQVPLVELMLEFSWPTGSTQQLYALLLDASTRPTNSKALADAPAAVVVPATPEDAAALTPISSESATGPAKASSTSGMVFEMAIRSPIKNREHAGVVSSRRSPSAAGQIQDRLRLAQAQSSLADRIAKERREADQQARVQELERNARQMRMLADQMAAAAPQAASSAASSDTPPAAAPSAPPAAAPASKAPSLLPKQNISRDSLASTLWLWVLAGLTMPLFVVWVLRFWLARRRPEFIDSAGAAASVFELSPTEAENAYRTYTQQRQTPVCGDTPTVEDARALFVVGRLGDAQQLLDSILRQNSRNHEAWLLQARVLCARGDSAGLAQRMPHLRELTGETGELWDRVLTLGQDLDPSNPLYEAAVLQSQPQEHRAELVVQPTPAIHKVPASPITSSAVDDALRMATAYGARRA